MSSSTQSSVPLWVLHILPIVPDCFFFLCLQSYTLCLCLVSTPHCRLWTWAFRQCSITHTNNQWWSTPQSGPKLWQQSATLSVLASRQSCQVSESVCCVLMQCHGLELWCQCCSVSSSPASGPCSTDSPGSSLSIDEGEGEGWGGYGHSLTPDEPVILEENCSDDAMWPGSTSLLPPVRKFSPSQMPTNVSTGSPSQVQTETGECLDLTELKGWWFICFCTCSEVIITHYFVSK